MLPITSYTLARINLVRAACPFELMAAVENVAIGKPIVIEKNRHRYGVVEATGYCPSAIVVSGGNLRSKMLQQGVIHAMAFVEPGSMDLAEDAKVSFKELLSDIQSSLHRRLYGKESYSAGHILASIEAVFPLDNCFVFEWGNKRFRQAYSVNPKDRKVVLAGHQPVTACGDGPMPRVQDGLQQGFVAPFKPPTAGTTRGGARSELMTEIIRDWSDINEAVNMYVGSMKAGFNRQLTPTFHPVDLKDERKSGEIVDRGCVYRGSLIKAGIDPFEFAKWSAEAQHSKTKKVGSGQEVSRGKFLYTPSSDPSSWKLPVPDASHVRNALARINQTQGIPSDAKPAILSKLRKLAKHHGVGVSSKPTGGQKKWAGHKVAATISAQI